MPALLLARQRCIIRRCPPNALTGKPPPARYPLRLQVYKALRNGAQPVAVKVLAVSAVWVSPTQHAFIPCLPALFN